MKIEYISIDGIHHAEKDALEKMRQAFNASPFSQKWHGFAGFMMMDTVFRDREIDLVLLTHDRLLIVELKNWRGRIEPMQDHWLLNGNDMGRSPVKVMADKWKILSTKIKDRLPEPAKSVWIEYRVVLCGTADAREIPIDERKYVLSLDDFLKISKQNGYQRVFGDPRKVKPNEHIPIFSAFFRGRDFKPTEFSFNNFQIVGEAIFPHPDNLYKEYRSVKKDDHRHQALLRRWDFSVLAGKADTIDERARIALREHRALGYIHEQNEDLDALVLQPLSHPTRDDVNADFCELYKLPARQARLTEFINRYGPELRPDDRLGLVKVLLSHFADLHDIGVAHRDIGDHSIWLERPAKVSLSGFITAHFPEAGTVGGIRDIIRAGDAVLPEDSEIGEGTASDPFRRDVYLLGVAAHYLLYLRMPVKNGGVCVWSKPDDDPYEGAVAGWLSKALDLVPSERFANAREMLNALNATRSGPEAKAGLDMRAFEAFRTDSMPTVVYRLEENVKQEHCHLYKSSVNGEPVAVKIWYGLRPDHKRVEESHQLLEFLEKARLLKGQRCEVLPEIIDYGLSDAGAFLVQSWVDGVLLKHFMEGENSPKNLVEMCQRLIKAVMHLHGLGFQHGDLHPSNIVVDGGAIRLIDAIDIFAGGIKAHYNPAYVPVDFESVPLEQRDCFACAKICEELLALASEPTGFDFSRISDEIRICLSRELRVYALDRILDAINAQLMPPPARQVPVLTVRVMRLTVASELASDNGEFHVGVFQEKNREGEVSFSILGVRKQILIRLDVKTKDMVHMRVRDIPHSQFVRIANQALTRLDANITLAPAAADDATELIDVLFNLPTIAEEFNEITGHVLNAKEDGSDEVEPSRNLVPSTEAIWQAIIDAEEATLPEVEIAGQVIQEVTGAHRVRIPYSNEGEPLDYDPEDVVEALQELNGELIRIGELNTRETSGSILVIDNPRFRMRSEVGEKIKLRSLQDLSSFRRRRLAVTRILNRESVIPTLIDYFDPVRCPRAITVESEPMEEELDAYDVYNEQGKLKFSLNPQQREAFRNLWTMGPISLLQGPPGTGKTSFIAAFIHYALMQGAQSILLASQSHEAVNNAAERVNELCIRTDLPLDLVRFGAEGMVSDPLRPYHSSSILQTYRELFRSEMRERVTSLSRNLGLSPEFAKNWFDLDFHLGRLVREITRLVSKQEAAGSKELNARINQRTERFMAIARERFGYTDHGEPKEVLATLRARLLRDYNVRSDDAVSRLDQAIAMAQEWVDRLGTVRSNFEEFLAKTRTLVCGTCVGLGRSQFGIAKNPTVVKIVVACTRQRSL